MTMAASTRRWRSPTARDSRAPAIPPARAPADSRAASSMSVWPRTPWVITPAMEVSISASMEVGAARIMLMPTMITISGTKITPPPTPKYAEITPARKEAAADRTITACVSEGGRLLILGRRKTYTAAATSAAASNTPNIPGSAPTRTTAPRTLPGKLPSGPA